MLEPTVITNSVPNARGRCQRCGWKAQVGKMRPPRRSDRHALSWLRWLCSSCEFDLDTLAGTAANPPYGTGLASLSAVHDGSASAQREGLIQHPLPALPMGAAMATNSQTGGPSSEILS